MPGFNQKGPLGEGPMTGRRMGRCTNYGQGPKSLKPDTDTDKDISQPDNTTFQPGRGMAWRWGRRGGGGRGRGWG